MRLKWGELNANLCQFAPIYVHLHICKKAPKSLFYWVLAPFIVNTPAQSGYVQVSTVKADSYS